MAGDRQRAMAAATKEINAAYEEINRRRSAGGSGHGGGQAAGYGGGYGSYQQTYRQQSGSSVLQQVRIAIQTGNLTRAEALLANYTDHNAEWNFRSYQQTYRQQSGSSVLQQVRIAIQTGNLTRAEALLANYTDHNAEWNFLRGAVCYRRGWMDEAKRYYETACQMDPGNPEYRQALEFMKTGTQRSYRPGGGQFGTDLCGGNICLPLCCLYSLCPGGYCFFC